MKQTNHFDMIILGGGSAGLSAARTANNLGKKTLILNTTLPIVGTCLNAGCVPSKRLLYVAELLQHARANLFNGVELSIKKIDFAQIMAETNALIEQWRVDAHNEINQLEHVLFRQVKTAYFTSPHEIESDGTVYSADYILIATGAYTQIPAVQGFLQTNPLTNQEIFSLKSIPKRMIVIGSGATGLEIAQLFSRLGSKVTILEHNETIFPHADADVSKVLAECLLKEGIDIFTQVSLEHATINDEAKMLYCSIGLKKLILEADLIFVATGLTGNTQHLKINNANVALDEKQRIYVNKSLQTNQPHIYAAGDVINAPFRLEPTAKHEAAMAVLNAFGHTEKAMNYDEVPNAIFTDPQLSMIGLREKDLSNKQEYRIITTPIDDIPKATLMKQNHGILKLIVHDKSNVIVGMQMVGPDAAEVANLAMTLILNKTPLEELLCMMPIYPTMTQAIHIALSNQ